MYWSQMTTAATRACADLERLWGARLIGNLKEVRGLILVVMVMKMNRKNRDGTLEKRGRIGLSIARWKIPSAKMARCLGNRSMQWDFRESISKRISQVSAKLGVAKNLMLKTLELYEAHRQIECPEQLKKKHLHLITFTLKLCKLIIDNVDCKAR